MGRVFSLPLAGMVAMAAVAICGCGGNPYKVVEIGGTVTYEGRPVGGIGVIFMPEEGRPSFSVTDESGRFALAYGPEKGGAQVGKHQVIFEFPPSPMDGSLPNAGPSTPDIEAIIAAYGTPESPLTVEITDTTQDLKIELP